MKAETDRYARFTAKILCQPLEDSRDGFCLDSRDSKVFQIRGLGLAAVLLALIFAGGRTLCAQQYPQQYAPDPQQTGYGQPDYAQPQQYQDQQYQDPGYSDPGQQGYAPGSATGQPSAQPLNTEQLEQLVAPIALYPDTLVAQILAAATYPAQVVDADHWRQAQGYASPDQIVDGANMQSWDPSVKALTAFPQVLAQMDQNLRWTIALGNAYYNQPQDVLDIVQVMRQRAEAAGNLQSTPQESVSYDQGYIQVAPVNPQLVYLPTYNPWTVYGEPIQPYRGFSLIGALGSFFGSSPVQYGLRFAMSAFTHTSWGWLGWGLDWLSHALLFHNSNYYSHSTTVADWGLPHGGPRAVFQRPGMTARLPNNGYRAQGGYGRPTGGPLPYRGGNNDYRPGSGQAFARPGNGYVDRGMENRYAENRPAQAPYRGYQDHAYQDHAYQAPLASSNGYVRSPQMEAYNRPLPQPVRPMQQYGRTGFGGGSSFYSQGGAYGGRPSPVYNAPQPTYRMPSQNYQRNDRNDYAYRSSGSYGGKGFEGSSGKSGGFHLFGGGHEHEPKMPHSSGHEHAEHSGHSGGHSGGGHHR
jgi:hypothetical protein